MDNGNYEIERKFLVKNPPSDYQKFPSEEILQGYVSLAENNDGFRLRKMGEKYFLNVKRGKGLKRFEIELELLPAQFEKLWPLCGEYQLSKTRYFIPASPGTIELDIYHGRLSPLITVEMEFRTKTEASEFNPPEWFDRELTEDMRFSNRNLSIYGKPE